MKVAGSTVSRAAFASVADSGEPLPFPDWLRVSEESIQFRSVATTRGLVLIEEEYLGASMVDNAIAEVLLKAVDDGDIDSLHRCVANANGTFAVIVVCFSTRRIGCVTDFLGIHPVYVDERRNDEFVVSTSFCLANQPQAKEADLAGVLQRAVLGICLGARTPVRGITRLRAGEAIIIDLVRSRIERRVTNLIPNRCVTAEESWPELAKHIFSEAVTDRLRAVGGEIQVGFLSGGLDSRVVIAELLEHSKVQAFTFSRPRTQEYEFSKRFAEANALRLTVAAPAPDRVIDWAGLMRAALLRSEIRQPHIAWSGDGGSVCCGSVYCSEEQIEAFKLEPDDCALRMMKHLGIRLPRLFARSGEWRHALEQTREDLKEEIIRAQGARDDRSCHFFYMLNDQHRHLDLYFDRVHIHKVRFLLPFFDRRVLQFWLSLPLAPRLYHKLYMKWFDTFKPSIRSTPWQTYPNHVPCPIIDNGSLPAQWQSGFWPEREANSKRSLRRGSIKALRDGFSNELLSQLGLFVALTMDISGLRKQTGALAIATEFADLGRGSFQQ